MPGVSAIDFYLYFNGDIIQADGAQTGDLLSGAFTDVNITDNSVNFSAVSTTAINGNGTMAAISMSIPSNTAPGSYDLYIAVGDVYDAGLLPLSVSGGTFKVTVLEEQHTPEVQNFTVNSGACGSYTQGDEFSVTFTSDYVHDLGTVDLVTEYDNTLLELTGVTLGSALTSSQSALWATNSRTPGYIRTSYIAPYGVSGALNPLITYSFRVKANTDDLAVITLEAQNVCDTDRVSMNGSNAAAVVTLYQNVPAPVYPKIILTVTEDTEDSATVSVTAEEETNLAAGDFTVTFDNTYLTCTEARGCGTGMVVSNIKNDSGKVTFSFIYDGGLTADTEICRLTFAKNSTIHVDSSFNADIDITGKSLVNDDLNAITVDYISAETEIFAHELIHHDAKAPTCTEIGWDAYDTCSRCDYTTYAELPALSHDLIHHDAKAPTCTESGWNAYDTCSRCDYTTYAELPALGHDLIHNDAKDPT